jgi:hypothetical protein
MARRQVLIQIKRLRHELIVCPDGNRSRKFITAKGSAPTEWPQIIVEIAGPDLGDYGGLGLEIGAALS